MAEYALTHTHVSDTLLVHILIKLIFVLLQEGFETALDLLLNAFGGYPVAQWPFDVFKRHVQITQGILKHMEAPLGLTNRVKGQEAQGKSRLLQQYTNGDTPDPHSYHQLEQPLLCGA